MKNTKDQDQKNRFILGVSFGFVEIQKSKLKNEIFESHFNDKTISTVSFEQFDSEKLKEYEEKGVYFVLSESGEKRIFVHGMTRCIATFMNRQSKRDPAEHIKSEELHLEELKILEDLVTERKASLRG